MKGVVAAVMAALISVVSPLAAAQAQPAAKPLSEGEVRKLDKPGRKMVIKHGPLANLDMPPMTMEFSVKDATLLDNVKTGQKVRFRAEMVGGKVTVVALEPAP